MWLLGLRFKPISQIRQSSHKAVPLAVSATCIWATSSTTASGITPDSMGIPFRPDRNCDKLASPWCVIIAGVIDTTLRNHTLRLLQFRERATPPWRLASASVARLVFYRFMSFADLGLSDELLRAVADAGYDTPTPIQEKAIPNVLMGRDIMGCAQTGTGKTASFTLPMLDILSHGRAKARMPRSLILEPTRELAAQVADNFETYGKYQRLSKALLIGGESMAEQIKSMDNGVDVLIATPGRLLDLFDRGRLLLNDVKILVIDEADRMLDMGFEEDLMKIHEHFSDKLQMVLFSATLFPEIKKMAKRYADNYEEITVGNPTSVASSVEHIVVKMDPDEKFNALKYLIRGNPCKTIVFFNTIKETTNVANRLKRQRFSNVDYIHSKIDQPGRESIINDFRAEKIKVLLASDVAARGIDIPNVEMVVNYDIPHNSEDYIHRVGRTGRAGKEGTAISFYSRTEKKKLDAIEKLIGVKIKRVAK